MEVVLLSTYRVVTPSELLPWPLIFLRCIVGNLKLRIWKLVGSHFARLETHESNELLSLCLSFLTTRLPCLFRQAAFYSNAQSYHGSDAKSNHLSASFLNHALCQIPLRLLSLTVRKIGSVNRPSALRTKHVFFFVSGFSLSLFDFSDFPVVQRSFNIFIYVVESKLTMQI